MGCPQTITYTDGEWLVTETSMLVLQSELEQYGEIGADTGWVGNPDIKQYRVMVSESASTEMECCSISGG